MHAWKVCIREIVSWVRIPLSPPLLRVIEPNHKIDVKICFERRMGVDINEIQRI